MTDPNNVLDKLNSFDMSSYDPDTTGTGGRGWTPPDGTYNVQILTAELNPEGMSYKDGGYDPSLTFHYLILDGEHEGKEFRGERFILSDKEPPTEGAKTAREIEMKRLSGHITSILNRRASASLGADLQETLAKLSSGTLIGQVRLVTRKWNDKKTGQERFATREYIEEAEASA